jgi:hypothetical protein
MSPQQPKPNQERETMQATNEVQALVTKAAKDGHTDAEIAKMLRDEGYTGPQGGWVGAGTVRRIAAAEGLEVKRQHPTKKKTQKAGKTIVRQEKALTKEEAEKLLEAATRRPAKRMAESGSLRWEDIPADIRADIKADIVAHLLRGAGESK